MPTPSQPLVWADGKWMMKHPTSFALKPQTCPEKSGISFWPQGGRRRNTHLVQRCWRSSAFCHSATPPLGVHKTCSRSTAEQNVSSMDLLGASPTTGLREVEALTVSGLSVVLVAQWAGEALALSPWKHQLQAADELGLAHTVSWTTADNYKIWTLTCRKKWADCLWCSLSPFVSALYLNVLCTISLSGCVVFWGISGRSLQLPIARSEDQEFLGPFGPYCKILHKARRAKRLLWNASLLSQASLYIEICK